MKALFVHDTYYARGGDGHVYTLGVYPYSAWERYLDVFDEITVVGRQRTIDDPEEIKTLQRSDGPNVDFCLLPSIHRPDKLLTKSFKIRQILMDQMKDKDALIIRGPSEYGLLIYKAVKKQAKVIAIELSGCAFDNTYYHHGWLGKLYAPIKYKRVKKLVRLGDFVMYVTEKFLQNRYPTNGVSEHASNVEIYEPDKEVLENRIKDLQTDTEPYKIGMIGHTGNKLKGLHIALDALGKASQNLPEFRFHILGKGDPEVWRAFIDKHSLSDRVIFDGLVLAGKPVLAWLDKMDFYIQPSLHEGLPRSLIEAMSRGLPCLASDTGGIPELLDQSCIHDKGNSDQLARHLIEYLPDQDWKCFQARKNFQIAKKYTRENLVPKRQSFWKNVAAEISRREQS